MAAIMSSRMMLKSRAVARASFAPLPLRSAMKHAAAARPARLSCQASRSGIEQFANDIGLPTEEGLFGFKPFAEKWVGRLAMMGFLTSIVEEAITGRGTLQQIGIETPSIPVLVIILALAGVGSIAATTWTLDRARTGKMSRTEVERYKKGFGLKDDIMAGNVAKDMKRRGDFTSPDDMSAIAAAQAQPKAADRFLAMNDAAEADAAAREAKSQPNPVLTLDRESDADVAAADMKNSATQRGNAVSLAARNDVLEQNFQAPDDFSYAEDVEIRNGRWAMLGFLAAIAVEAATGKGIIMQTIAWLKLSGLLGDASGFPGFF